MYIEIQSPDISSNCRKLHFHSLSSYQGSTVCNILLLYSNEIITQ